MLMRATARLCNTYWGTAGHNAGLYIESGHKIHMLTLPPAEAGGGFATRGIEVSAAAGGLAGTVAFAGGGCGQL